MLTALKDGATRSHFCYTSAIFPRFWCCNMQQPIDFNQFVYVSVSHCLVVNVSLKQRVNVTQKHVGQVFSKLFLYQYLYQKSDP